jgi:ketosteroid isomerase-like protein
MIAMCLLVILSAEQEVLDATKRIFDATSRLDLVELDALLSDDYHYTSWHGEVMTKEARLTTLRSLIANQDAEGVTLSELRVPLLRGDVAVVVGRAHQTGRYQGQAFDNHYRFTSVFQKQSKGWVAKIHQVTRIEAP